MGFLDRLRLAERKSPGPDTAEHGDSGVSWNTNKTGSPQALREREYNHELWGPRAYTTYERMRSSDPKIRGLRYAQNLPLLRASADFQPADPTDNEAMAMAAFAKEQLLERFPWRSFVQESRLALDFGFAAFEIIWAKQDGKAIVERLALRPASTFRADDIYVRKGAIDHVVQSQLQGAEPIDGGKLVWFSHEKEGDDFRGQAILRPMYKPWRIKEDLEVGLVTLVYKMGGMLDIKTQNPVKGDKKAALEQAGRDFGINPYGYFLHDDDIEIQLLSGTVAVKDVLDAIQHEVVEITSVCQAQVLDLGANQAGSRALGSTLADMFADSIQAQANHIEDVLNAHGGLVHQLIAYNFPRDDLRPKLRFGNVQRADMKAMAQSMLWLSQAFSSNPLTPELQDWVFAELNMPQGTTAQVEVPAEKAPPDSTASKPGSPGADGADGTSTGQGAQASESHSHDGLQLAERRPPRGVEVYLNLTEITAQFDTAKTAVKDATQQVREALVKELVRRARTAADKGQLPQFAAGAPPMVDKLAAEIQAVLSDFYGAGRQQVADELDRQRDGKPWTAESIRAAEAPPASPAEPSPEGLKALRQQAEAMGRTIGLATQASAAMQAGRIAAGTPVDEDVMAAMVLRESDAAALRFVGAASDFMSMGRSAEATAQAQDVEDAVYSALLDGATCAPCEGQDGAVTTDLALADTWAPNPSCEGGERCRCLVAYEIRQGGF